MIIIKKLDRYLLSKFLLVFVGAFFVCLFVFMMQFTWRYVDELIGKGLSLEILAQFFWYMGLTLVPQALPLSLLLASLITFGNLGESFELLSMKAAGISLVRIMRPLAVFAVAMCGVSFYFQNFTSPEAQINLTTLLFSMKQQSPAVEIPEGVFYNGVPQINIFVQRKNAETGMLYQTIIYKADQGFDRAQIVLADSARLEITRDKQHLRLDLWNGEQFEALQGSTGRQMMGNGANEPYDRETFLYKQLLIDFDSNFSMMDKEMLSGMAAAKNMRQIAHSVDSINQQLDSLGRAYYAEAKRQYFRGFKTNKKDSIALAAGTTRRTVTTNFDTLLSQLPAAKLESAKHSAASTVGMVLNDLEWKSMTTEQSERNIRLHWREWHQKITFSLACILFFFIGAPLGAIIRKGGLGLPTVISVIIFIFWYIINTSGSKMARDGTINMFFGMWVSTFVLLPFSAFFSYKANKDSTVFNMEAYRSLFFLLFGLRDKRHIFRKEVIIDEPRLDLLPEKLAALAESCRAYHEKAHLLRLPSYADTFFRPHTDTDVEGINDRMEAIIEELSNSRDPKVLSLLNELPILFVHAHTLPFRRRWLNVAAGIFFPLGLILWFRIGRFRLRLYRDMRRIVKTCDRLTAVILGNRISAEETEEEETEKRRRALRVKNLKKWVKWLVFGAVVLIICIFACKNLIGDLHFSKSTPATHKTEKAAPEQKTPLQQNGKMFRLPAQSPALPQ